MTALEVIHLLAQSGIRLSAEGENLRYEGPRGSMTGPLRDLVMGCKRDLLAALRAPPGPALSAIPRVDRRMAWPLSFAQERLWFLHQLMGSSPVYHVPGAVFIKGAFHQEPFRQAILDLVGRHEVLRTTFTSEPRQVIHSSFDPSVPVLDLSAIDPGLMEAGCLQVVRQLCALPFDMEAGPLFRFALVRWGPETHVVLYVFHHVLVDAWSLGLIREEFKLLYESKVSGRPVALPALPIQYVDFAVWQRRQLEGPEARLQRDYWMSQLEGFRELALPLDRPRRGCRRGGRYDFRESRWVARRLSRAAESHQVTSFVFALCAFQLCLAHICGMMDVSVGTDVSGRNHHQTEHLVGFFVNQLVLRSRFRPDISIAEAIQQVRRVVVEALLNQDIPFETLVREVGESRDRSKMPLFEVKMVLVAGADGPSSRGEGFASGTAKYDLLLTLIQSGSALIGQVEYNKDVLERTTIERIMRLYRFSLCCCVRNSKATVAQLHQTLRAFEKAAGRRRWGAYSRGLKHSLLAKTNAPTSGAEKSCK